jgi:tubulin-specific chaperone C
VKLSTDKHISVSAGLVKQNTCTQYQHKRCAVQDCTVRIYGTIPTLFLHRLSNCSVVGGPVAGATFGEGLQGCNLQLATHQLRLHSSTNVLVHLRVASSPIIEHCASLGFGKLTAAPYSEFEAACAAVQLPDSEHWKDVQDFLHPGSTQTSNWYMIKESSNDIAVALDINTIPTT